MLRSCGTGLEGPASALTSGHKSSAGHGTVCDRRRAPGGPRFCAAFPGTEAGRVSGEGADGALQRAGPSIESLRHDRARTLQPCPAGELRVKISAEAGPSRGRSGSRSRRSGTLQASRLTGSRERLQPLVQDRVLLPILEVEMPPLVRVHGEALRFHRLAQLLAVPALEARAAGVVGI